MSSGGGISRFASRNQTSSNEGRSATTTSSENIHTTAAAANKFSFGFNENSDALSTTSDDEFGFLGGGGGGNSVGGDDFFMSDGGYNHEHDTFVESSGDSTISKEVSELCLPRTEST